MSAHKGVINIFRSSSEGKMRIDIRGIDLIKRVKVEAIMQNIPMSELCHSIIAEYFQQKDGGNGPNLSVLRGKKKK